MTTENIIYNPFSIRRWEFETEHVVWIPEQAREVFEPIPCHVQGVRGAGKTAILRIADYYTRRSNNLELFNEEPWFDNCLGIYVSFIEEFATSLETEERTRLFYDNTILYCVAKVFKLLDDASRDAVLQYSRAEEEYITSVLVEEFDLFPSKHEKISSFNSIASHLRRHCKTLRSDSLSAGLHSEKIISSINSERFFERLTELLKNSDILIRGKKQFYIKICIDDAHLLSPNSQSKLNNILYRSRAPIFWNIAYVEGQFDPNKIDATIKYVTGHDRHLLDLNYRTDNNQFKEICEKVFALRVEKLLKSNNKDINNIEKLIELHTYIGRISYEISFDKLVSRSKKTATIARLSEYRSILENTKVDGSEIKNYQLFIASCQFSRASDFKYFCESRTIDQIDNYLRQKAGSAIVIAARQLERAVPYEGLNALLYLSDGCIRDFLALCSSLFYLDSIKKESKRAFFVGNKLPTELQTRAFRKYSTEFVEAINSPRQPYSGQLSSLIEGIGYLTYLLQTEEPGRAITQPDKGLFRVGFQPAQGKLIVDVQQEQITEIREVLKEAIYTGAIRLEKGNILQEGAIEFRLSGVMCPRYQTSARKPTKCTNLGYSELLALMKGAGEINAKKWAEKNYKKISDTPVSDEWSSGKHNSLGDLL